MSKTQRSPHAEELKTATNDAHSSWRQLCWAGAVASKDSGAFFSKAWGCQVYGEGAKEVGRYENNGESVIRA